MNNTKKKIIFSFIIWFFLTLALIFVHYTGNTELRWIDMPTHFVAGFLIASLISGTKEKVALKKIFVLSFLVFLGWELFEISASVFFHHNELIINMSKETLLNGTRDVVMDASGLAFFFLIYKTKTAKIMKSNMK